MSDGNKNCIIVGWLSAIIVVVYHFSGLPWWFAPLVMTIAPVLDARWRERRGITFGGTEEGV